MQNMLLHPPGLAALPSGIALRQTRVLARPGYARNINTSRSSLMSLCCTLDFFLHSSPFSFTRPLPPDNALVANTSLIAHFAKAAAFPYRPPFAFPSFRRLRASPIASRGVLALFGSYFPGALLLTACVPAHSHYGFHSPYSKISTRL
ncbi:hypothetical protein N656DRAFT_426557 [Canariomyces notabilis]|uniref:Uncharacterized protein n=1 Tax=Canariomyces notabilis TaxID=2074819 RepID=A0AAN6QDU9_9PEZI|nr:hypothetical protein N656DRAFT_426557 [Canariomyces arenarius]